MRPNIFQHTRYPRVCHPLTILQAICLLQSLSRSRKTSRLSSNATLPMTVARGPSLLVVIVKSHNKPSLGQLRIFPCLPLLLGRLGQKPKILEFRSSRELPKVIQVYMVSVRLHWVKPSCSQHAIPRNIHTSTSSPSLLW